MLKNILAGAVLLAAIGIPAQAGNIKLGYASGVLAQNAPIGIGFGDNQWIDEAIRIPASTMKTLAGARITTIAGCLPSIADISTIRIWVKSDLEGESLAEFELVPNQLHNIKKGYNKLAFKTPWEIPADFDSDLYIGFGHKIKSGNSRGLSATETPMPGAFYLRRADGKWYDFSDRGTACVEAEVEGDNLPALNLNLGNVATDDIFVVSKATNKATVYVQNFGTDNISGFDVTAACGDVKSTQHVSANIAAGEMGKFSLSFDMPGMPAGDITVTYTADKVNAATDADADNNSFAAQMLSVSHDYPRHVLSEEFTTERCGNCPEVVQIIHNLLQKPEFGNVIQVCHHAGYHTDFLTEPWHETFVGLFGGGTFAPGLAVDRVEYKPGTQVFFPENDDMIIEMWKRRLAAPALVSVNVSARYTTEDKTEIEVTVRGEKSAPVLCEIPCVNIMLLESGIAHQNQTNAYEGFTHDFVSRAVSAADYWGDKLEFDGDAYVYSHTFTLDKEWKTENMQIVAYVGNNGTWKQKEIKNAGRIDFADISSSGVDNVAVGEEESEVRYFDLTGQRLSAPVPGVVIRQVVYNDGSVRNFKEVAR